MLIEAATIVPAGTHPATAALPILRHLHNGPIPTNELIIDRGYSMKTDATWASQLRRLNITHVIDLETNQRQPQTARPQGSWCQDGTPHCPATPTRYRTLQLHNPGNQPDARKTLATQYNQRHRHAFTIQQTLPDAHRYTCPARTGKVCCPSSHPPSANPAPQTTPTSPHPTTHPPAAPKPPSPSPPAATTAPNRNTPTAPPPTTNAHA